MAESVRRETAFNIEIPCIEIYKELPSGTYGSETMLLQGVIDCWFEAEDGIVLLDYKTDYVPSGGAGLIRERYRIQLDYYTRALEKITGKKVGEKYLYLFHSGELLSC
jgi:ATP-dependent helicase/nuclease subunit A